MTRIKYAGPRPEISQHGISYKDGKEDKYVYLMVALEILSAIDHNYEDRKSYSVFQNGKAITEKKIHTILQQYEAHLEEAVENEEKRYELKIQDEINSVQQNRYLTQIDKDAWCENINIMKEYRIQRAINKIYYIHCINDIKNIIRREKIKEIDTPFDERFWHVLETIEGALETGKNSVATKLQEETNNDGNMIIKLYILF